MTAPAQKSVSNWVAIIALAISIIGSVIAGTVSVTRIDEKVKTHDTEIVNIKETNKQLWRKLSKMQRKQDETNINLRILLGNRYKAVGSDDNEE